MRLSGSRVPDLQFVFLRCISTSVPAYGINHQISIQTGIWEPSLSHQLFQMYSTTQTASIL